MGFEVGRIGLVGGIICGARPKIKAIGKNEKKKKGKLHYWSLTFTQVAHLVPNV